MRIRIFNWESKRKLEEAAISDELTGIYNRRGFLTVAEQQLTLARRLEKRVLLFSADIDNFKSINDKWGHEEGDRALIKTANILKDSFRQSDIIGRIGGDEFTVFLTEDNKNTPEIITERVQRKFDIYNEENTVKKYKLSLSCGIARCMPEHPCVLKELIIQADRLMYKQKNHKH